MEAPINRPTILKIHRDLLFDPKSTEKELEVLPEKWQEALGRVFSEYHPVFIGYAGNDHSVMDFLQKNRGKFASGEWKFPYWLVYKESDFTDSIRVFLENANGYLVPEGDFDRVMCLLSNEFGYKLPSEEDTVDKAKKQYKSLVDDFIKYTAPPKIAPDEKPDEESMPAEETAKAVEQAAQQVASESEAASLFAQANTLFIFGEHERAQEIYHELINLEPNNAVYHNNLGIILHKMERYEEALVEKQRAIELEPDNARCHDNLGATLHEMKRYEEARVEKQKAVELDPDDAWYHYSLGITLHEMRRYEEARVEKQKAVELEPDDAWYHYHLSLTLRALGRDEEADAEKRRAHELEPDNPLYQ